MYTPQTLDGINLRAIANANSLKIDAESLFEPARGAPFQRKVRFLSKGEAPNTTVCFGPYISLRPGTYIVHFHGDMSGPFDVSFTRNSGQHVVAHHVIRSAREALFFDLPGGAEKFEIVIRTTRESHAMSLDRIDLLSVSSSDFAATGLLPPQLHELRHLQTQPAATNQGVANGRNIRAGYLRGKYISSGEAASIQSDPDWIAAQAAAEGRAIAPPGNLLNLFMLLKYSKINDNIIEFGAFRGGTSLMMAALLKRMGSKHKVFALDTFGGMPTTDPVRDAHLPGGFSEANYEDLVAVRDRHGLDNLVILKGLFQDTVSQITPEDRHFFLAHIDCDIYESAKFSINYMAEYAVPGAYMVFDDPLVFDCIGALQAVEEELVQKRGLFAEQAYPHMVYRYPALG